MNPKFLPFALVFLAAPAVFAQDYAIHLQRPLKAGDEETLSITGKQSQATTVTVNGVTQKDVKSEVSAQFDGSEKVIEVDGRGKETKVSLTVDKFIVTADGESQDIMPKGTVVTCSVDAGKKQVYEVDGKAVAPALVPILDMVVDLGHGEPSDDVVYGTKDRKKKGESWDLDGALVKTALEAGGSAFEFNNLTGKTTLDDVADKAMKITVHFTGDAKPPLPPALTLDKATVEATFRGTFPIDPAKYQLEDSGDLIVTFTAHPTEPTDEKVVAKSTLEKTTVRKITPVK